MNALKQKQTKKQKSKQTNQQNNPNTLVFAGRANEKKGGERIKKQRFSRYLPRAMEYIDAGLGHGRPLPNMSKNLQSLDVRFFHCPCQQKTKFWD